jgi:DNA replication and repair protein RecF
MNNSGLSAPKLILRLTNFRNFKKRETTLSPPLLLVGPNAVGKTNLLEAVFLLATSNSFKRTKSADLIYREADFATVNLKDPVNKLELELRLIGSRSDRQGVKKEVFLNQRRVSLTEFIGNFQSVIFSPESLHIIKGPPQERRSFLDTVLSQANREYLRALLRYRRVKKERNRLLFLIGESRAEADELEFWDQELIESGSRLIGDRAVLINFLNRSIPRAYRQISQAQEPPTLIYQTNALGESQPSALVTPRTKSPAKIKRIKEKYRQALKESYQKDLKYQTTHRGPHRDEIIFNLGSRKLPATASQGEIRSLALGLKLSEQLFLEQRSDRPVNLLLDDPLSELDQNRGRGLLKIIQKKQSITTALPEELSPLSKMVVGFQVIKLNNRTGGDKNGLGD